MNRAKIVNHYLEKTVDQNFTILDVRQELEKGGIDEEEIRIIVRLVDNELQRRIVNSAQGDKAVGLVWLGGVLTAVGLIYTIGTYFGLIEMGSYFLLAYGPILGGISILLYGLGRRR